MSFKNKILIGKDILHICLAFTKSKLLLANTDQLFRKALEWWFDDTKLRLSTQWDPDQEMHRMID